MRALEALRRAGAPVTTVDILPDPAIRQELSALSGWPTIPQVFVRGELVGGADIVEELEASGDLERTLEEKLGAGLPRLARGEDARGHVLRSSLTSRTANTGSVAATTNSAAPKSVACVPIASAIGPAIAKPTGISAIEPSASYEYTRESRSPGICCCIVVSQQHGEDLDPEPRSTNAAAAITTTCGRDRRAATSAAASSVRTPNVATSSIRSAGSGA